MKAKIQFESRDILFVRLLVIVTIVLVASQYVISKTTLKPTWEWVVPKGIGFEKQYTKIDAKYKDNAMLVITFPTAGIVTINRLWADDEIVSIYLNNQDISNKFDFDIPFGESVVTMINPVPFAVNNQNQLKIQIKNTNSDTMGLFINFDFE
jgi:hypothetical protein